MWPHTELSQNKTHPLSTEASKFKELTESVGASQPLPSPPQQMLDEPGLPLIY